MLNNYQKVFQDYVKSQKFISDPPGLSQPVDYIFELGGKRVRPSLCILAFEIFKENVQDVLPQALAIEMFHNFSLVHDDIMDEAPLRRGHETVHNKYGINSAVLSGDAMLILTYHYLSQGLTGAQLQDGIALFTKTALQICRGQQYDMDFEKAANVSLKQYLKMIKLKTAVLLGTSLALGANKAGAKPAIQRRLRKFGIAMGMAFQVQDDLLDIFGDPQKTGKQRGGDILQNKKTFAFLKSLEISGERTGAELRTLYEPLQIDAAEKVARVTEIFQSLGIEEHGQHLKREYLRRGLSQLEKLDLRKSQKELLWNFFEPLLDRDN